jgi:surface polysaccharide O-acyltransferase-like enzyme
LIQFSFESYALLATNIKEDTGVTSKVEAHSKTVPRSGYAKRRHELDLLRGLVVLALIPFHTATYFIIGRWAPLHYSPHPIVQMLIYFSSLVAMPLMFFIAGMGVNFSLRKRTVGAFVGNRFQRLFVPLAFSHLLLLPFVQFYVYRFSPLFEETFAQFYPTFFDVVLKLGFPPYLEGSRYALHQLWFIKDLLVYTLVLLPVFVFLRSMPGQRVVKWLASVFARPWTIFLLGLPLAGIEAALGAKGDWNIFSYILMLLYGFLLVADSRFGETLRRVWKIGLLTGLLLFLTVGVAGLTYFNQAGIDFQNDPGLLSVSIRVLKGIVGWALIIGLMGLGESIGSRRKKDKEPDQQEQETPATSRSPTIFERAARYLSRATLPIYVTHIFFVVVVGFYVGQWTTNMWIRFLTISTISMLGTLAVYDIVRRNRLTRLLFGMRMRTVGISPPDVEPRGVGKWLKANLPHVGLWTAAALFTVVIIITAGNASLIGKWEQTLDTTQAASGYQVEFRNDGTWTVTADDESLDGLYELLEDDQIKIIYADGTTSISEYRITYDRFGLISTTVDRKQVFMRIP